MSVKRSEFEVRLHTPLELAGAEEGAGELERAIGKAKALGRDFGRMERQLARTREGMRRFRLTHAGVVGQEVERQEKMEERQEEEARKEMRYLAEKKGAGKQGFRRRSAPQGQEGQEDQLSQASVPRPGDPASGHPAWAGTTSPRPETDTLTDRQEGSGTGTGENAGTDWPEADSGSPPAAGRSDGEEEEGKAAGPVAAEAEEPVTAVWHPEAARREIEQMVREIEQMVRETIKNNATAQARREISQEEDRLAAVETRLRRLEERWRTGRDL
jgi:hypothetical protein